MQRATKPASLPIALAIARVLGICPSSMSFCHLRPLARDSRKESRAAFRSTPSSETTRRPLELPLQRRLMGTLTSRFPFGSLLVVASAIVQFLHGGADAVAFDFHVEAVLEERDPLQEQFAEPVLLLVRGGVPESLAEHSGHRAGTHSGLIGHDPQHFRGAQDRREPQEHGFLHRLRRDLPYRAGLLRASGVLPAAVVGVGDIVLPLRVVRHGAAAASAPEDVLQWRDVFAVPRHLGSPAPPVVGRHELVHLLPQPLVDDGLVLALEQFAAMAHLADVGDVVEELVYGDGLPWLPGLLRDSGLVEFPADELRGLRLPVSPEDAPHGLGLFGDDHQAAVGDPVAEGDASAHPHSLLLRGRELVADALGDDLALVLREGDENVDHHAPGAGGRVDVLGDGAERDAALVELARQLRKVGDGARQAVQLVDHHHVDLSVPAVGEEPLQRGAVRVAPGAVYGARTFGLF